MEIKENELYVFRLATGQEIIAKLTQIDDDGYHLDKPLTLMQGEQGMQLAPITFSGAPLAPAVLSKDGIMVTPIRDDLQEVYEKSVDPSEIITPSKQIITG
jgi:hypothetical protein